MYELRNYQKDAIDFISLHRGRGLLALPPGSGKTFTSLYLKVKYPQIKKMLVICPASIKLQWRNSYKTMFPSDNVLVLSGSYTELLDDRVISADCIIVNFEILPDTKRISGWGSLLEHIKFDMIIIDESHKVKNKDSKRSKAIESIVLKNKHVVMLTGTPILSNITDLWNQLHLLEPHTFTSFGKFEREFCPRKKKSFRKFNKIKQVVETVTIWDNGSPRNLVKLKAMLNQYFFIRDPKDIFKELPDVIETKVPVYLSNFTEYHDSEQILLETDRSDHDEMYRSFQKVRKIIGLGKVDATIQWISDFFDTFNERKLVVFGFHRSVLEALHEHYKNESVLYYGGMTDTKKEEVKEAFINDEEIKIIFANIKSGGTGVDGLHLATNTVLFAEMPDSQSDITQAVARIRRLNSEFSNYLAYFLVAENTIDERLCELVLEKKKIEDLLFKHRSLTFRDVIK